jgi:redox-sensitive bicupin YhaK (pirin superfamily)
MPEKNSKTVRIIPATEVSEGAGVTVNRTIGTPALRNLDPFLMLDHFGSKNPDDYIAGFPSHPHRGFITFTYMLDGHIEHKDSMGNTGNLESGGAQWMKAASGVIHSEMPKQENGLMRGFQLWINLPAAHKMDRPEYQEFGSHDFPLVESPDHSARVLIGEFAGESAPVVDQITGIRYLDVTVRPGKCFETDLQSDNSTFLYLFEGEGELNSHKLPVNSLALLDPEETTLRFSATGAGARFIFVSGKSIGESIVQYGPFVMNTREEIDQAMRDYQSNNFVRDRAWIKNKS